MITPWIGSLHITKEGPTLSKVKLPTADWQMLPANIWLILTGCPAASLWQRRCGEVQHPSILPPSPADVKASVYILPMHVQTEKSKTRAPLLKQARKRQLGLKANRWWEWAGTPRLPLSTQEFLSWANQPKVPEFITVDGRDFLAILF